ncbi:hypothetical protein P0197_22315, partial [Klebsiella pneumoniae]
DGRKTGDFSLARHCFQGGDQHPHRSTRKYVMKRLALALLLFIFKELVVASVLTPEADHYDSYLLVDT